MAKKVGKGDTSKNAKTNRKAVKSYHNGQVVRPVVLMRNPLGTSSIMAGVLTKISAGRVLAVQLEDGSLLMNNGLPVLWDDIASQIVRK